MAVRWPTKWMWHPTTEPLPCCAMPSLPTAVQWSHHLLAPRLRPGDAVVDATAGNGHDSLFLAQSVLPGGNVFVFDVQAAAIDSTRRRLAEHGFAEGAGLTLIHAGHEELAERLPPTLRGCLRAIMFNLGFLPGGDKSLITGAETTLRALETALDWLAEDGVLTLVAYPGHDGGHQEAAAVEAWLSAQSSTAFEVQKLAFLNFRPTTPFGLWVRKRSALPPVSA